MAWIGVNQKSGAVIFNQKPVRRIINIGHDRTEGSWVPRTPWKSHSVVYITKKRAQQIVGFKMTWKDDAVRI